PPGPPPRRSRATTTATTRCTRTGMRARRRRRGRRPGWTSGCERPAITEATSRSSGEPVWIASALGPRSSRPRSATAPERDGLVVTPGYTAAELMVAAAAREIRDGEVVFVGMRLPLLAFCLARSPHPPRAVGLFENGVVRDSAARDFLVTMSDGPNVTGAVWCTEMREVMGLMQAGRVTLGFIGGAQVDRFGNLNTTYVGPRSK